MSPVIIRQTAVLVVYGHSLSEYMCKCLQHVLVADNNGGSEQEALETMTKRI